MSRDGFGADPGCPEPLLPPDNSLGRDGRVADLQRYLDRHRTISIAEYMERYGIGQRRAVSELRRFPGLVPAVPAGDDRRKSTSRRRVDRYELATEHEIGEIEEMIGYTSAGFPYATHEEISGWIGLPGRESDFPAWLRELAWRAATKGDELTWFHRDRGYASARRRR